MTFLQRFNDLFFGVDVSGKLAAVFDSLRTAPKLKHVAIAGKQMNLNVAMEMNSEKAWSTSDD